MHVELLIQAEGVDSLLFAKGTEDLDIPEDGEVVACRQQHWLVKSRRFYYFELDDGRDRLVVTLFAMRTRERQAWKCQSSNLTRQRTH